MIHSIEHEGVTYKFELLTIGQEDEWKNWLRDSIIQEAVKSSEGWPMDLRAKFLAEISKETPIGKCSFMEEIGAKKLASIDGMVKVLELASKKNHPNPTVPFEVLTKLVESKTIECMRVMLDVLPVTDKVREAMLGGFEKKVVNGQMVGPS